MKQKARALLAWVLVVALFLVVTGCQPSEKGDSTTTSSSETSASTSGTVTSGDAAGDTTTGTSASDTLPTDGTASTSQSATTRTTSRGTSKTLYDAATTTKTSTTVSTATTKNSTAVSSTTKTSTTASTTTTKNSTAASTNTTKSSVTTASTSTSQSTTSTTTTTTTTTTTKAPDGPLSTVWEEMPANTNKNLKYFGYFHSDGFASQSSYMADIAALGNANIVMINSAWNASQAAADLAEAKKYGFKAIVTAHGMFQYGKVGKLESAELVYGWEDYWDEYQATVQSYIDDGTIYAFYFDEPRWNGISCEDFQDVCRYIRQQSGVGMMACMTAMDMGWSNYGNVGPCEDDYLKYCTDVMFDDYGAWDAATRKVYLMALKSKSPEDAWVWGCPRGMEKPADLDTYGMQRMIDHIQGQYREAVGDERYAGIISFSFANGINEGDWGYGLRDFFDPAHECYDADFRQLYVDIGREIIG